MAGSYSAVDSITTIEQRWHEVGVSVKYGADGPSCSPWVGLTLLSMSRAIIFGGRRSYTRSIQKPDRAVNAARLSSVASYSVSKRPIWLVEAATTIKALAIHDGSHRRIARQSLGIVHILVSGQASKHRLTQQARQQVARLSGSRVISRTRTSRRAEAPTQRQQVPSLSTSLRCVSILPVQQASIPSIPVQTPNPVDLTQSRHAGAGQPNRLDGLVSLAEVIPTGSLGVGKRLPDDGVEFRVHAGMKARPKPEEKPRRARAQPCGAEYVKKFEPSGQPNAPTSISQNLTATPGFNRTKVRNLCPYPCPHPRPHRSAGGA